MNSRLTVFYADRPARSFLLHSGSQYVLGRDSSCEFHLDDPRVSRRHAAFSFRDGHWYCVDIASKNGLRVDGHAVHDCRLNSGAWLDLGGLLAQFTTLTESDRASEEASITQRHELLDVATQRMNMAPDLRSMLDELLSCVLELGGMQRAFLMRRNALDDFEIVAMCCFERDDFSAENFSGSLAAVHEALTSQRPLVSCDVAGITRFADRPSIVAGGIRALVCLPLSMNETPDGVIYADSLAPGKVIDELGLEILTSFADNAAVALAASALRSDIELLARQLSRRRDAHGPARASVKAPREEQETGRLTLGDLLRTRGRHVKGVV